MHLCSLALFVFSLTNVILCTKVNSRFYFCNNDLEQEPIQNPGCFLPFAFLKRKVQSLPNCYNADNDLRNSRNSAFKLIAEGNDGSVYRWERPRDGKLFAIKIFRLRDKSLFKVEADMLYKFNGSGITPDFECVYENENSMRIMMEFLDGVSLRKTAEFYNPMEDHLMETWVDLAVVMSRIVEVMHGYGVVHLDLHLNNWILTPEGRLYVIDFSRARELGKVHRAVGWAPEIRQGSGFTYSTKSDVWSLGQHLRHLNNDMRQVYNSQRGIPEPLDNRTAILLKRMVANEPEHRPTLEQVIHQLKIIQKSVKKSLKT